MYGDSPFGGVPFGGLSSGAPPPPSPVAVEITGSVPVSVAVDSPIVTTALSLQILCGSITVPLSLSEAYIYDNVADVSASVEFSFSAVGASRASVAFDTGAFLATGAGNVSVEFDLGTVASQVSVGNVAVVEAKIDIIGSVSAFGYQVSASEPLIVLPIIGSASMVGAMLINASLPILGSVSAGVGQGNPGSPCSDGITLPIIGDVSIIVETLNDIVIDVELPLFGDPNRITFSIQLELGVVSGYVATGYVAPSPIAYSINTQTVDSGAGSFNPLTTYENFNFIRMFRYKGKYYGIKSDGVYLLEGGDDDGTPIACNARTSLFTVGSPLIKNVVDIYLRENHYPLTIDVTADDGFNQATYQYLSKFNGQRVKVGRGLLGIYWDLKFANIDGGGFSIGAVELETQLLSRRV